MAPRKRAREKDAVEHDEPITQEPTFLQRLRNMWQFASLMQYITLFGSAVRLDSDFDIDVSPSHYSMSLAVTNAWPFTGSRT